MVHALRDSADELDRKVETGQGYWSARWVPRGQK